MTTQRMLIDTVAPEGLRAVSVEVDEVIGVAVKKLQHGIVRRGGIIPGTADRQRGEGQRQQRRTANCGVESHENFRFVSVSPCGRRQRTHGHGSKPNSGSKPSPVTEGSRSCDETATIVTN